MYPCDVTTSRNSAMSLAAADTSHEQTQLKRIRTESTSLRIKLVSFLFKEQPARTFSSRRTVRGIRTLATIVHSRVYRSHRRIYMYTCNSNAKDRVELPRCTLLSRANTRSARFFLFLVFFAISRAPSWRTNSTTIKR